MESEMTKPLPRDANRIINSSRPFPIAAGILAVASLLLSPGAEVAWKLKVKESELPLLEEWSRTGLPGAGFGVWGIPDVTRPKLITHRETGGGQPE
jgi:hypothetical protein